MFQRFCASVLPPLRVSARERTRQIPVRAFLAALLAWSMTLMGLGRYVPLWLAAVVFVQAFELLAMAPFTRPEPPRRLLAVRVFAALFATFLMSAAYSGLAAAFWTTGGVIPVTVALLVLSGGMLNNVASGVDSRPLFYVGLAPYVLSLAALPLMADEMATRRLMPILVVSILLFYLAIHSIWSRTHLARRAEVQAREEAERQRAEAEEAVADRAAMAAIVSHELRTPLSAILAGAHMIRTQDAAPQSRATAGLIVDAGQLMTGLLNDLLDSAKIEARAMTLEARPFDLRAEVQDAASFWAAVAAQKGVGFRAPRAGEPIWVTGDPYRLRQVLNNLLSNALKFTQEGEVALRLDTAPAGDGAPRPVRIGVRDNGPGITEEAMARLFTPYAQGSLEVARTYGGTGLGLTVSRELARLMGGDLTARSEGGDGAEFLLDLELPAAAPVVLEARPEAADLSPSGLRVLAVDDHEINRRTLAIVLEPLGVTLTTAIDGLSALKLLDDQEFDVVLMDVNMPGMDGRDATRRLRARAGPNQHTPVIGFSAGVEPDQIAACMEAGMNDWVAKPLEPRILYEKLTRLAVQPA